jgi:hypothetical protein
VPLIAGAWQAYESARPARDPLPSRPGSAGACRRPRRRRVGQAQAKVRLFEGKRAVLDVTPGLGSAPVARPDLKPRCRPLPSCQRRRGILAEVEPGRTGRTWSLRQFGPRQRSPLDDAGYIGVQEHQGLNEIRSDRLAIHADHAHVATGVNVDER